jgi:uncharacterized protein YggT (Ycf19 family)
MRPFFLTTLIQAVMGIIESLIALRVLLKFLGANLAAPFVRWVYQTTQPLVRPFEGMFPSPQVEGGFVLEFSALFAVIAYAIAAYLLLEFIGLFEAGMEERERKSRR